MSYVDWLQKKEAFDVRGNEYDSMKSTGALGNFQNVLEDLEKAKLAMEQIISNKKFNVNQLIEIRKTLLSTIRNNIDLFAFGHMPDKRHY